MSSIIAARKCVRHPVREAVARCPACSEHYCRECVVEHAGALLCTACLAREVTKEAAARPAVRPRIGEFVTTLVCIFFLLAVFYAFGHLLKLIPIKVHEGTVWQPTES